MLCKGKQTNHLDLKSACVSYNHSFSIDHKRTNESECTQTRSLECNFNQEQYLIEAFREFSKTIKLFSAAIDILSLCKRPVSFHSQEGRPLPQRSILKSIIEEHTVW